MSVITFEDLEVSQSREKTVHTERPCRSHGGE